MTFGREISLKILPYVITDDLYFSRVNLTYFKDEKNELIKLNIKATIAS